MICQSCGVEQLAEARFCEDCGTPLQFGSASETGSSRPIRQATGDASTCSFCGYGPDPFGGDGFCSRCGQERVDVSRNHVEVCLSPQLAGVSDVGKKHFRNEDALALASKPEDEVLVVCDGVSMSQNPDLASAAAASAALEAAGSERRASRQITRTLWSPPRCRRRERLCIRFPSSPLPSPTRQRRQS